jgi:hypothetical protein
MNEKVFSRRDFMKIGATSAVLLAGTPFLSGCSNNKTQDNQSTSENSKQEETMSNILKIG